MKFSELTNKSQAELQETLKTLRINLGRLRFELASKSLKDVSQIQKSKKDIARLATALNHLTDK